ncbi:sigma-70 family RNA polymerase sigma factor [Cryobacterium sp. CG_9.6]|uniref:sigma-70 family RNA polymerase sigma factor n=1 Tax=Cryobacterium sp. CG_9.6 TaxID=2760710 RepID=UPI0024762EF1|nr:sigma-70 family RNA polymerase sigma factor [Cryobacterium sp. CG_9.6]MDH6237494.1 RNA polymerase primary sigma factor [Cryobacterium sp. CG_9.6]
MTLTESATPHLRISSGRCTVDGFGDYLRKIGRTPLLTAAEEVELAQRIEVGLCAADKLTQVSTDQVLTRELEWLHQDGVQAKNEFIEANLRLVVSVAKHYHSFGLSIMDLVQDGNIGLVRAVEKFDFATGFKFSTYAVWWIRQAVHRGICDRSRMIRVPTHTAEQITTLIRVARDLETELQRQATLEELADAMLMKKRDVARLFNYDREPLSLATPIGDGEISEMIIDEDRLEPDDYANAKRQKTDITFYLDALPSQERSVLVAHFGLEGQESATLEQISHVEGVTKARIRQLEKRALAGMHVPCLKQYLED